MPKHEFKDMQNVLRMAITQTHRALDESNEAVNQLSTAFLAMATEVDELGKLIEAAQELPATSAATMREAIIPYRQHVMQATVAFQFYDKFSQNMHHLITTLAEFDAMIAAGGIEDPAQWQQLKDSIRQRYTMEQEHRMLDAIEAGASPDEAVAAAAVEVSDDIELF